MGNNKSNKADIFMPEVVALTHKPIQAAAQALSAYPETANKPSGQSPKALIYRRVGTAHQHLSIRIGSK
jgi:hypothetical protein